jgi:hypothetical protein
MTRVPVTTMSEPATSAGVSADCAAATPCGACAPAGASCAEAALPAVSAARLEKARNEILPSPCFDRIAL